MEGGLFMSARWPEAATVRAVGRTDATKALVIGNRVYDPLLFSRQVVRFSRRQYLFLNAYRLGTTLEDAAYQSGMTPEQAERFLKRPMTRSWMQDRAQKDHIRSEWHESNKWWEMGDQVLNGQKHLSKDQQVVYLEFGKRVCPEVKVVREGDAGPTINFNFGPEAVKEAIARQAVIDAEVSA
jgi:hypothetical protein